MRGIYRILRKRGADGKGTMTVRFTSDEQMQRFLDALENASAE